jgi:diphosphoinositol-polyphosphate diphosphatase
MLVARPLSMTPRKGRDLQRYSPVGERLVTGVVPFYCGRVVMISSNSGQWILPKGGWEADESVEEAAAREAYEEAGVLGAVKQ